MKPSVSPIGAIILIIANGALSGAVFFGLGLIGLELITPWGWVNLGLIHLLFSWYLADGLFARRAIYRFFGLTEPYMRHAVRFWRAIGLLALFLLGVAATIVKLQQSVAGQQDEIPQDAIVPLAAIVTAFLASTGVLLTRYEQGKADRTKTSLDAIREQLYGTHLTKVYDDVRELTSLCRKQFGIQSRAPIPVACMKIRKQKSGWLGSRPTGKTLEYSVDQFFNALNQLALGVRMGHLDHTTVELLLRPRYLLFGFVFFEYIRQETKAEVESNGRWRSQNRTWEHMLWFTSKLPMLKADGTDWQRIVMPPDHIIGGQSDELLLPPQSSAGGPFGIDWDLIDSAMKKREKPM